jgi:hypothetical protein
MLSYKQRITGRAGEQWHTLQNLTKISQTVLELRDDTAYIPLVFNYLENQKTYGQCVHLLGIKFVFNFSLQLLFETIFAQTNI